MGYRYRRLLWHRCRNTLVRCMLYKIVLKRYLCRQTSYVRVTLWNNIENDRKTGFTQFLKCMYTYKKKQRYIRNEMNIRIVQ